MEVAATVRLGHMMVPVLELRTEPLGKRIHEAQSPPFRSRRKWSTVEAKHLTVRLPENAFAAYPVLQFLYGL
jgi:hypothetical protein